MQRFDGHGARLQHRFRQLEFDRVGWQAVPGQQALDVGEEVAGHELLRRHVDRDARVRPPAAAPPADRFGRRLEDPVVQVEHQAGLLGDLDELAGRYDLVVAAPPAQQGLDRRRALPAEAHLRLVVEHEVPALDGLAQGLLHAEAV